MVWVFFLLSDAFFGSESKAGVNRVTFGGSGKWACDFVFY